MSLLDSCPCGLPSSYEQCCGRYHQGPLMGCAPTPEAVMRSRYSAFVLDLRDYLLSSWHASTRPALLEPAEPGLKWLGLEVRRSWMTGVDAGTVEFVARSKLGGRAHRLHEVSRFVRDEGHWYYVDAAPESRG